MTFIGLSLITENVPRLVAFYERLFGVRAEGDDVHATLALPGLNLALYSREASIRDMSFTYPPGSGSGHTVLMFSVESADAEFDRVKSLGIPVMTEPTVYPWGAKAFHFRDPDGTVVDFVEPPRNAP